MHRARDVVAAAWLKLRFYSMILIAIGSAGACGYWLSEWRDSVQLRYIEQTCAEDKLEQQNYFMGLATERSKRIDELTDLVATQTDLLRSLKRSTDVNARQARTAAHAAQKAVEAVTSKTPGAAPATVVQPPPPEVGHVDHNQETFPRLPYGKQR